MAAGGSEGRAPLSRAEFEQAKLRYLEAINQDLEEAAGLMEQVNRNLDAWSRRAGQVQALAQVWSRFQTRLGTADSQKRDSHLLPPPRPVVFPPEMWSYFQARLGAADPPGRSLAPPPPQAPQ